jgi:hypothetical protein
MEEERKKVGFNTKEEVMKVDRTKPKKKGKTKLIKIYLQSKFPLSFCFQFSRLG